MGIDVSHHQGQINWKNVRASGIHFAYIKETEGENFKDSMLIQNIDSATVNGIAVGVYHFYSFCKSGLSQALNFITSTKHHTTHLPPVVDIENVGNCKYKGTIPDLVYQIREYLNMIEREFSCKPVLYTTPDLYNIFLSKFFDDYPVWIRSIGRSPSLTDNKKWLFWQADVRMIPGVSKNVDINFFRGTANSLWDQCNR
jgi:lysozyme